VRDTGCSPSIHSTSTCSRQCGYKPITFRKLPSNAVVEECVHVQANPGL
jgi:hypothetical protein